MPLRAPPQQSWEEELAPALRASKLRLMSRGKVRDTYTLRDPSYLLVFATDRISVMDFVLGSQVKDKGEVLTALSVLWFAQVLKHVSNHLVAYGRNIDDYVPKTLRNNATLQRRALVVRRCTMVPYEAIARGYLTGSAWKEYQKTGGRVFDYTLPPGLHDGARLLRVMFTPTTKAEQGHDEWVPRERVRAEYPWLEQATLDLYQEGAAYAAERQFILADTKFEFGLDAVGNVILCDEVFTPDSSRWWARQQWLLASNARQAPPSFDKEPVRKWAKGVETPFEVTGLHALDPANEDHVRYARELQVPPGLGRETTQSYNVICDLLCGMPLKTFQYDVMGIH